MLLQVVAEGLAHGLLHGTRHLAVAQLGLGLALKLRLCHLDGDDCGETLAEVLARYLYLRFLYLLGYGGVGIGVCLQRAREGHAETREVRAALYGVDIVDV